jgi:hypothetical protein
MFLPTGDYSESRPFKIFISLLDKWEIGAPLTDVLVYDAFKAIKQFVDEQQETSEDVSTCICLFFSPARFEHVKMVVTASTLYEAVEPQAIWRHLLRSISGEVIGSRTHCEVGNVASFRSVRSSYSSSILREYAWLLSCSNDVPFKMKKLRQSTCPYV